MLGWTAAIFVGWSSKEIEGPSNGLGRVEHDQLVSEVGAVDEEELRWMLGRGRNAGAASVFVDGRGAA